MQVSENKQYILVTLLSRFERTASMQDKSISQPHQGDKTENRRRTPKHDPNQSFEKQSQTIKLVDNIRFYQINIKVARDRFTQSLFAMNPWKRWKGFWKGHKAVHTYFITMRELDFFGRKLSLVLNDWGALNPMLPLDRKCSDADFAQRFELPAVTARSSRTFGPNMSMSNTANHFVQRYWHNLSVCRIW